MSLDSTSTYEEVVAAYRDNASYEETGDVAKARAFVTACRFLLQMLPSSSVGGGGERVDFDTTLIAKEMETARNWISSNASAAVIADRGVAETVYHSMRTFR